MDFVFLGWRVFILGFGFCLGGGVGFDFLGDYFSLREFFLVKFFCCFVVDLL